LEARIVQDDRWNIGDESDGPSRALGDRNGAARGTPPERGPDDSKFTSVMARYCDGDARAFEELYAGLAPRILGYLRAMAGEQATAEDLLQQTFMKLHQCRATYVRGANPVPWLYTIAHRTCIDEMRRRSRSRVRLSKDGELPHEPSADITGAAEAEQPNEDDGAVARGLAALASLPDPLRQAVVLIKIHGHSSAEAASIVGTTVGAIKVRAHRGYVALRRKLQSNAATSGTAILVAEEVVVEANP
jgi:RNA polymerase sigma-70 factor (ECF subfamily)